MLNVGATLRACFDVALVVIAGRRYASQRTDTARLSRHPPTQVDDLHDVIPFDCVPVAVSAATTPSLFATAASAFMCSAPDGDMDGPSCPGVATSSRALAISELAAAVNIAPSVAKSQPPAFDVSTRRRPAISGTENSAHRHQTSTSLHAQRS